MNQIPLADDGTSGPTELHTYFTEDKIPEEMTTIFLEEIATLENVWGIKHPATPPKKPATCNMKLSNDNEVQQAMKSVHGIRNFGVSVVPASEMRKGKRMNDI